MGHPLEFWDSADIILDGTVISTHLNEIDKLVQHDVRVEQYFKNPKPQKMITVYGPDTYNEDWFYPKFFKEGESALFYLKKIDDKYIILEQSRAATEGCSPRDMIGLSTLPGEPVGRGGPTLFFDPYQTCNGYLYSVDYLSRTLKPLKQFEAGIKLEDIRCEENLVIVVKIDGLPACVKKETKEKLIERGWGKDLSTILLKIPLPKISQIEAIKTVENDLKNHVKNSTKILRIVDDVGDQQKYIPFSEFQTNNKTLPLVFVSTNGTLLTINNASLRINGWCNMGTYTYCGYMQPFNLDYKSRLVYGLDIIYGDNDADMQPAFYAVDAISGEIVDSSFLRSEAREK